jgi:ATP-dependent DNA ligase
MLVARAVSGRVSPGSGRLRGALPGKREGQTLQYVGKVGTGSTMKVSADLRRHLDAIETPKSRLTRAVRKPKKR